MEQGNDDSQRMTIGDAIRLKHALNQGITVGRSGMNAKQYSEFEELSAEDWQRVHSEYRSFYVKTYGSWTTKPLGLLLSLAAAVLCYWLGGAWRIGTLAATVWVLYRLSFEAGQREGYMLGYPNGHATGIRKAFGVTAEELPDIGERAMEMTIDEGLARRSEKES